MRQSCLIGGQRDRLEGAHPDTTTKAGGYASLGLPRPAPLAGLVMARRNAGFIRQPHCGSPGCWMNPAFRWWCQDVPARANLSASGLSALRERTRMSALRLHYCAPGCSPWRLWFLLTDR